MSVLDDPFSRPFARLAGLLYVVIAISGFFSILWVPSQLVTPDPLATAEAVAARAGLFRMGVLGDVVMMVAEVLLSVMIFAMFRPWGAVTAGAAMVARLMMAAVMAAMLLFQAGVMTLSMPGEALGSFSALQRAELAQVLRAAHDAGVWVWQVFFALHLVLLSVLVLRSGVVPRVLGWGLGLGSTGYMVDSVRAFAFPDLGWLVTLNMGLLGVVTLAEIGFALWLLTRGRVTAPQGAPA